MRFLRGLLLFSTVLFLMACSQAYSQDAITIVKKGYIEEYKGKSVEKLLETYENSGGSPSSDWSRVVEDKLNNREVILYVGRINEPPPSPVFSLVKIAFLVDLKSKKFTVKEFGMEIHTERGIVSYGNEAYKLFMDKVYLETK